MYNLPMPGAEVLEFDPRRPFASGLALIRAVLFSPRRFYETFSADGPTKEPALFVALVSVLSSVLGALLYLLVGIFRVGIDPESVLLALLQAPIFAFLSPVAAGVYLLSIRAFAGVKTNFAEVYRMLAYAYGVLILAWVPLLGAFAVTYALMVLMAVGIRRVYRVSVMTAVIVALVAFVPVISGFILLQLTVFKGIF